MRNLENNPENSRKDRIKFRDLLIRERQVADKIIQQYNQGRYHSKKISKYDLKLLQEFKKIYTERKQLQKKITQQKFIEDERIGFGGKGEHILEIQPDETFSNTDKYILKIAKVLQIADNFNK